MRIYLFFFFVFLLLLLSSQELALGRGVYYYSTDLLYTVLYCLALFPTAGWPTTSALAADPTIYIQYPLYLFLLLLYSTTQSFGLLHCSTVTRNTLVKKCILPSLQITAIIVKIKAKTITKTIKTLATIKDINIITIRNNIMYSYIVVT